MDSAWFAWNNFQDDYWSPPDFNFPYASLGGDEGAIRLAQFNLAGCNEDTGELSITLCRASLDAQPRFCALSYHWGEAGTLVPIVLGEVQSNGSDRDVLCREAKIRPNLHDALCLLLRAQQTAGDEFVFWVDSLCINQSDSAEKDRSIPLMEYIYSRAERVYAWVGRSDDVSRVAMPALGTLGFQPKVDADYIAPAEAQQQLEDSGLDAEITAIYWFLHRGWFQRVWVLQEVTLASSAVLLCGEDAVPWPKAMLAFQYFHQVYMGFKGAPTPRSPKLPYHLIGQHTEPFVGAFEIRQRVRKGETLMPLALCAQLAASTHLEAMDRRDKVWGLMGLLSSELREELPPVDTARATADEMGRQMHRLSIWVFDELNRRG